MTLEYALVKDGMVGRFEKVPFYILHYTDWQLEPCKTWTQEELREQQLYLEDVQIKWRSELDLARTKFIADEETTDLQKVYTLTTRLVSLATLLEVCIWLQHQSSPILVKIMNLL